MQYIVFSIATPTGEITHGVYYNGTSKTKAVEAFKARLNNAFSIMANAETVYFAGFASDLPFVKDIKDVASADFSDSLILALTKNMKSAICRNTLTVGSYKPQVSIEQDCEDCDRTNVHVHKNAYGKYLCADCWTDYLKSEAGLVEYYIGIADESYNKVSFSEEDLESITKSWSNNKTKLQKTAKEIELIEANYMDKIK